MTLPGWMSLVVMGSLSMALTGAAAERPRGRGFVTRSTVVAQHGMACTSHPLATQAALDVLKAGGSAVDAAIAANACLGLMEPTSCGIGGDLFALVWEASSGRLHGLNGSGRSARRLSLEWFREHGISRIPSYGPLPVTVPGCVDGWFLLHGRFGKLPMNRVLAPAIGYARDGFPVTEVIAEDWAGNAGRLKDYPNFADTYMPGGRAPRHGEVFRNPALSRTLERIAAGGRDAFYRGEVAATIARYLAKQGGFLDEEDLAAHTGEWVEPISTTYRGYEVWEIPPNGQGLSVLQMLNILEGYDLRGMGWGSPAAMHAFIEAKKLAFEDRARHYGDPAFSRIPLRELLEKSYAARRRELIRPDRAATRYEAGDVALRQSDTIYLCTADAAGNMVSLIQSNYRGMGSGMTPDNLGFVLHDRGEAFVLQEGHPNSFAPGKRPFHTIIPAFVTHEGKPWMAFGVMGGDMQPQGHVQILMNLLDFGMGLQEAGDAPRIYHTGSSEPTGEPMAAAGGTVNLEPGFPEESVRDLVRMGHRIGRTSTGSFGGYQAIRVDPSRGVFYGASESRKDGQAAGY